MAKIIIAENSLKNIYQFTGEQWENMVNSGHAHKWKVLEETDDETIRQPVKVTEIKPIDTIENYGDIGTYVDISYELIDYSRLLDKEGIKYNKRIKDPEKLKAIYLKAHEHKPAIDDGIKEE